MYSEINMYGHGNNRCTVNEQCKEMLRDIRKKAYLVTDSVQISIKADGTYQKRGDRSRGYKVS